MNMPTMKLIRRGVRLARHSSTVYTVEVRTSGGRSRHKWATAAVMSDGRVRVLRPDLSTDLPTMRVLTDAARSMSCW